MPKNLPLLVSLTLMASITAALAGNQFWSVWGGDGKPEAADLIAKGYNIKASYVVQQDVYLILQGPKDAYRCRIEADLTALSIDTSVLYCDKLVKSHQLKVPNY